MPKKIKSKYPKLLKLKGLLAENEITIEMLAKKIGRAKSTVSQALNGHTCFDSMDMLNIRNFLIEKSGKNYTIEEIFFND